MKLSTLALTVSLLANAALVSVLALRPTTDKAEAPATTPSAAIDKNGSAVSAATDGKLASKASARTWERLRSDDLKALVPHLRAAGFPPDIVRQIVFALVKERFDTRRLEIEQANLDTPYWAKNLPNSFMDPKVGPELRKLQREQTELLRDILGGNIADVFAANEEGKAMLRYQVGDIPPEKIDQVYSAYADYGEKRAQIFSATSGGATMLAADREKLAGLEKSLRDDLAKFLSPSELNEINLHLSDASQRLRMMLSAAQPTEDEYRSIFPLYQSFQDQFPGQTQGPQNAVPPEQAAARKLAQDQMNNQIKAMLGDTRAAEIQQALNPAYSQINRLVSRLDLPISAASQVVAVQQDVQERAIALRSDNTLSTDDRRAQFVALGNEASAKISAALGGPRGLEAYKMNGGQWLLNFQPPPKARPAPASKG
jgi:hypothetical protein